MEGPNPFTQPPIVKTLFKFLPGKALHNAARVCKLWRSEADTCLRRRRQYCWQLFENTASASFLEKLQHYFEEEILFRPSIVMVFMTSEVWKQLRQSGRKRKRQTVNHRTVWKNFCERVLPSCCQVFCSITSGIVGTSSDLSRTTEAEAGQCASILCVGQHPGLRVALLKDQNEMGVAPFADATDLANTKMLLMMAGFREGMAAMAEILSRQPMAFIVGGVVSTTHVYHPRWPISEPVSCAALNTDICFVAFQGENVQVVCVKMDEDVTDEEKAEKVMKRLKDKTQSFPMERSVAFMFACVARGYHIYRKCNVESTLFRKYFPTTPLLGLFGNGEIGCEYPFQTQEKSSQRTVDLMNSYTTFITVVSLP